MQNTKTNLLLAFFAGKVSSQEFANDSLEIVREILIRSIDERSRNQIVTVSAGVVVQVEEILARLFQEQLISPENAVLCKAVISFAKLCAVDPKGAEKFVLPAVQAFMVFVNAAEQAAGETAVPELEAERKECLEQYQGWLNGLKDAAQAAGKYGYSLETVLNAADEQSRQLMQAGKLGGLYEAATNIFATANNARKKLLTEKIDSYVAAAAEKLFIRDTAEIAAVSFEEDRMYEAVSTAKKLCTLADDIKGWLIKGKLSDDQAFKISLLDRVHEMEERITRVEHNVEKLNSKILLLETSIAGLKERDENIEHKIALMNKRIDDLHITKEQLDGYRDVILSWMNGYNYNRLNEFSKDYLTQAEFLSEHYTTAKIDDFSVVVLQFCRALENELLHKLYLDYARNLINLSLIHI